MSGDREHVHNILIVTTDGKSDDKKETLTAATELHALNLTTLCIGIGGKVANDEIKSIASSPGGAIMVHDYDMLFSTVLNLSLIEMEHYACEGISPTTTGILTTESVQENKIYSTAVDTIRGIELGVVGIISSVFLGSALCCCRKFWAPFKRSNDVDDDEKQTFKQLKIPTGYNPNVNVSVSSLPKDDIKIYPVLTTEFEKGEW